MKRQGRLIEKIVEMDNLLLAYHKAQKGKTAKRDVIEYTKHLQHNLETLRRQILAGKIETGNYHYFTVYDPKKRLICAAPFGQRVLHHALMNICHPFFEKVQIFHSYASRKHKGTYAALEKAKTYTARYKWFLKLDFRKYSDSIDHCVLKQQLNSMFKDERLLIIFNKIIDSYSVKQGKGLPIGNLTSQYFANHYLAKVDHFIKEKLRIKKYIRYMDDLALWHANKDVLKNAGNEIEILAAKEFKLTLKPFCLNYRTKGLPFLGYVLYPDSVRLSRNSKKRFKQKFEMYGNYLKSGEWTQEEYQSHIMPLIAFTEHADAKMFRKKIIQKHEPV